MFSQDIILYLKNLQGRGVQKVYLNLAKGFIEKRYRVHLVIRENIIAFNTSFIDKLYIFENETTEQLDVLIFNLNNPILIANDVKYTQNLKNISPDHIYHTVHMLWSKRLFKQLRFKRWFEIKKLYRDKQVIAVSEAVKYDLLYRMSIKPKSIDVIYDGFDIENIKKLGNEHKRLTKPYILNIGALSREKNQKLLIETYAKLDTSLDLIIIGSGKLEKKLKELVIKLKLEERVHFLGFKSNPYPYIKNAKLLLLTSTNEGFHGVAVESLILDTPIVSSNSGGINSILRGKLATFIAKNSKELLEKTNKALEEYPTISSNYYEKFNYKYVVDNYIKLMRENR